MSENGEFIGVDAHMAREMRQAILGDEPLPSSGRDCRVNYGEWDRDSLIEYGQWLCALLELEPGKTEALKQQHINNASKLNVGPSSRIEDSIMSHLELQRELGFPVRFDFDDWTRNDFISAGQRLAERVNGRPTAPHIEAASHGEYKRVKVFPSRYLIEQRFDKLSAYQELIGYPSCRGWDYDDYMDWAAAFFRQNPGIELSRRVVGRFSSLGRGPSDRAFRDNFGGLSKFSQLASEDFAQRVSSENESLQNRLEEVDAKVTAGVIPVELVDGVSDSRKLQIAAQHSLATRLLPTLQPRRLADLAAIKSADGFSRSLVNRSDKVKLADVEIMASVMGVFDDLWPMYRFQNVDLRLPEAA